MARAYSQDLRDRIIDAALKGMSARQTATRFGVATRRRSYGCAERARPATAPLTSKDNHAARSSIRTATFCWV
jgi:transposase